MITAEQIADFQRDGAVVVRGVFKDWVDTLAEGVAQNMANPSEYASENEVSQGRFFDDYCNWRRYSRVFEKVVRDLSPAAALAAASLMQSPDQHSFFMTMCWIKEHQYAQADAMASGCAVLFC